MNTLLTAKRIASIWKENAAIIHCPRAKRDNLRDLIHQNRIKTSKVVKSHLEPWLCCFDEGVMFLNFVNNWIWEIQELDPGKHRAAVMILAGRGCTLAAAIRELVVSGFEDPARALTRTFHETLELILAILADDSLNKEYMREDDGFDENEFWKKHIGFGRINIYLQKTAKRAGFTEQEIKSWQSERNENKKILSGSIHLAPFSAFRSSLVPSLANPKMFCRSTFGHHSLHTPGLLLHLAEEIWRFGSMFLRLLMCEQPPTGFEGSKDRLNLQSCESMFVSFFTLQQLVTEETLPPLPKFESEEDSYESPKFTPLMNQNEFQFSFSKLNRNNGGSDQKEV